MAKKNKEEKSRTATIRKKRREKRKSKLYGELDGEFFDNSDDDDSEEAKAQAAENDMRWTRIAFISLLAICAIIFAWQRIESRNYVETNARITDWYSGTLSAPLVANKFGLTGGKLSYASQIAIVEYYFNGTLYEGKVKLSNETHSKNIKIYCDQNEPWKCRGEKLKYPNLDIFVICVFVLFGIIAIGIIKQH